MARTSSHDTASVSVWPREFSLSARAWRTGKGIALAVTLLLVPQEVGAANSAPVNPNLRRKIQNAPLVPKTTRVRVRQKLRNAPLVLKTRTAERDGDRRDADEVVPEVLVDVVEEEAPAPATVSARNDFPSTGSSANGKGWVGLEQAHQQQQDMRLSLVRHRFAPHPPAPVDHEMQQQFVQPKPTNVGNCNSYTFQGGVDQTGATAFAHQDHDQERAPPMLMRNYYPQGPQSGGPQDQGYKVACNRSTGPVHSDDRVLAFASRRQFASTSDPTCGSLGEQHIDRRTGTEQGTPHYKMKSDADGLHVDVDPARNVLPHVDVDPPSSSPRSSSCTAAARGPAFCPEQVPFIPTIVDERARRKFLAGVPPGCFGPADFLDAQQVPPPPPQQPPPPFLMPQQPPPPQMEAWCGAAPYPQHPVCAIQQGDGLFSTPTPCDTWVNSGGGVVCLPVTAQGPGRVEESLRGPTSSGTEGGRDQGVHSKTSARAPPFLFLRALQKTRTEEDGRYNLDLPPPPPPPPACMSTEEFYRGSRRRRCVVISSGSVGHPHNCSGKPCPFGGLCLLRSRCQLCHECVPILQQRFISNGARSSSVCEAVKKSHGYGYLQALAHHCVERQTISAGSIGHSDLSCLRGPCEYQDCREGSECQKCHVCLPAVWKLQHEEELGVNDETQHAVNDRRTRGEKAKRKAKQGEKQGTVDKVGTKETHENKGKGQLHVWTDEGNSSFGGSPGATWKGGSIGKPKQQQDQEHATTSPSLATSSSGSHSRGLKDRGPLAPGAVQSPPGNWTSTPESSTGAHHDREKKDRSPAEPSLFLERLRTAALCAAQLHPAFAQRQLVSYDQKEDNMETDVDVTECQSQHYIASPGRGEGDVEEDGLHGGAAVSGSPSASPPEEFESTSSASAAASSSVAAVQDRGPGSFLASRGNSPAVPSPVSSPKGSVGGDSVGLGQRTNTKGSGVSLCTLGTQSTGTGRTSWADMLDDVDDDEQHDTDTAEGAIGVADENRPEECAFAMRVEEDGLTTKNW